MNIEWFEENVHYKVGTRKSGKVNITTYSPVKSVGGQLGDDWKGRLEKWRKMKGAGKNEFSKEKGIGKYVNPGVGEALMHAEVGDRERKGKWHFETVIMRDGKEYVTMGMWPSLEKDEKGRPKMSTNKFQLNMYSTEAGELNKDRRVNADLVLNGEGGKYTSYNLRKPVEVGKNRERNLGKLEFGVNILRGWRSPLFKVGSSQETIRGKTI